MVWPNRVPVARTAQVETEYGEPVDWEPLEPLAPEDPQHYELCRCGRSKKKPFCDDTHETRVWGQQMAASVISETQEDFQTGRE